LLKVSEVGEDRLKGNIKTKFLSLGEEQARIVAILDKFDALTNSITEGLPREIELRQKQYEYYRDLLLGFPKDHPALTGTPPEEGNVFGVSVAENRSAPVFPSSGGVPEGRGGSL
jgi:hypothetical protein